MDIDIDIYIYIYCIYILYNILYIYIYRCISMAFAKATDLGGPNLRNQNQEDQGESVEGIQSKKNGSPGGHSKSLNNLYGYGSIPINTIFSGMNIHLPAILMFTRGTRF